MQQQCPTLAAMVAGFRREWPETRVAWGPRWHATGTLPACCCVACHRVARGLTHGIPAGMLAYVCGHPAPAAPLACCCGNAVCVFDRIKTWRTCFPPSQAMVSQVRRSHRDILPLRWVAALWHCSSGVKGQGGNWWGCHLILYPRRACAGWCLSRPGHEYPRGPRSLAAPKCSLAPKTCLHLLLMHAQVWD